ncbi:MAG: ABC transporter permease [Butyrivibrio sp.]|uniref:ABC transporter permease n=1 Tax=Butyrivibrio sp. TaxID=28121 RepID=UPI0025C43605|nr:ABC transporter permease [Butyrivibrio sp.]MBQ6589867.1 ABC transporter permease [Butyrivibrio sp.]
MNTNVKRHRGRITQTFIYLGKLFRMFLFQNDWKVLPMSAIIAGLVAFAVGSNLYVTMEGTLTGAFALACVCIWNGFFNSIQVICRERAIVKREHRSGLHISSYIVAHMIYQAILCVLQVVIMIFVCMSMGVAMPKDSLVTPFPIVDVGLTLFLITYCADMLALLISSIAKTTTAAMTIMPFMLIVQLLFSGGFFNLPQEAMIFTNFTATKWGLTALCAQGDYNSLPMVSVWNSAVNMKDIEVEGEKPLLEVLQYIERNDMRDDVLLESGKQNQKPEYNFDIDIVMNCWTWLIIWTVLYILITIIVLERIDKDKR